MRYLCLILFRDASAGRACRHRRECMTSLCDQLGKGQPLRRLAPCSQVSRHHLKNTRAGDWRMTDGPFPAETKEQLGGFYDRYAASTGPYRSPPQ